MKELCGQPPWQLAAFLFKLMMYFVLPSTSAMKVFFIQERGLSFHVLNPFLFPLLMLYGSQDVSLPPSWLALFLSILFWGFQF